MELPNAATVDDRPGFLRTQADGSLVWEADLDAGAVAALLRRAMLHGGLRCRAGGAVSTVRIHGCHYDAATGRIVVEFAGPPVAVS